MAISGSELSRQFSAQASRLQSLAHKHRQAIDYIRKQDQVLDQQLAEAKRELAAVYLRALTDADLERVSRLTGFQGFARRDPRQAIDHERKVLSASIAKIEGDDRFARRDVLVGPAGTLTQELDTMRETLAPLETDCARYESLAGFKELVEIGYDTPRFAEKWWHASYWKHWAAGDRICKELDMKDFGDDVLPAYLRVAEPRNFMAGEVARLGRQIDEVHDLVRERDRMVDRLAHIEEIYLAQPRDFLREHNDNADAALHDQSAEAEPENLRAVQMGVRKLAGIQAKRVFLADIVQIGVPETIQKLQERASKAQQKAAKFARPKHAYATFSNQTAGLDFDRKAASMETQIDKLQRRVDDLVASQSYAGFDLRNDQQMWWMYLVHAPPPRFAPHLHMYYAAHPGEVPLVDEDFVDMGPEPGDAAARAYAAGELEQDGYLS